MIPIAVISALLAWFGFANPWYQFPPAVLALPLGLLILSRQTRSPSLAFKAGWLTGGLFFVLSLYWMAWTVHNYGDLPWVLALPCPLLLAAFLGLYTGVFCLILTWARFRLNGSSWCLLAGCLWFVLEWLRGHLLTGFPWQTLPQGLAAWPFAIQPVAYLGAYAYAGLLTAICAIATLPRPRPWPQLLAPTLLLMTALSGAWTLEHPIGPSAVADLALVQGNINQDHKWDSKYQEATLETYLQSSRKLVQDHRPELIVWPETAMPFYLQEPSPLSTQVHRLVRNQDTALLTGSPGYTGTDSGAYDLHNRAYLLLPDGQTQFYDKVHLVPFGEYVPLGSLIPFIDKLAHGSGDFRSGEQDAPLEVGKLALGALICYEAIFPEISQQRVSDGANLLANISNDSWFGHSPAPIQHLHQAALRCCEQGRSMVRGTNSGISAFIDPQGRMLKLSPLFERCSLHIKDLPVVKDTTFFHRFRDYLQSVLAGMTVILILVGLLSRPKRDKIFF